MLLLYVELAGEIGMGAQRWIDLGLIRLQPSELMKISVVIVLARYFHIRSYHEIGNPLHLAIPVFLVLLPVAHAVPAAAESVTTFPNGCVKEAPCIGN